EEHAEGAAGFRNYGLTRQQIAPTVEDMRKRPKAWVDFMMRFELGLEQPDKRHALVGGVTIGGAYALGGLIPLAPYFALAGARPALLWSVAITLVALFVFGY